MDDLLALVERIEAPALRHAARGLLGRLVARAVELDRLPGKHLLQVCRARVTVRDRIRDGVRLRDRVRVSPPACAWRHPTSQLFSPISPNIWTMSPYISPACMRLAAAAASLCGSLACARGRGRIRARVSDSVRNRVRVRVRVELG